MKISILAIFLLVLICFTDSEILPSKLSTFVKRGLTWKAKIWPTMANGWAGKWGCSKCNPYKGDTPCYSKRPILCIKDHKSMPRPFYSPLAGSGGISDKGFYNGWTGGIIATTPSYFRGYSITSKKVGDKFCQTQLKGTDWQMAEHHMGYYMRNMNDAPVKAWGTWDWSKARTGGWSFWGYFATTFEKNAWVWIRNQANGNCN